MPNLINCQINESQIDWQGENMDKMIEMVMSIQYRKYTKKKV